MGKIPIEELLPRSNGSVYGLVIMASMRALELADGKPPLVEGLNTDKITSIALEEILKGKVECKEASDIRKEEAETIEEEPFN